MPLPHLTPMKWPQDKLRVPDGSRGMPPVNAGNAEVVGAEFFACSTSFDIAAATTALAQRSAIIQTPQDGDFWCEEIAVSSWEEQVGEDRDQQGFLASMLTLRDIRTSRSLILNRGLSTGAGANRLPFNSVPINLFRTLPQSGTESATSYDGSTPVPSGFRTKGTLIQPFCFTRQGGIEVTLTTLFDAPADIAFRVSIGFIGWKEYAHASR